MQEPMIPASQTHDSSQPDSWRELAAPIVARKVDQILSPRIGSALAPFLLDMPEINAASLGARLTELGRDGTIPRGIVLRKGQADQISAAVTSTKHGVFRDLGTDILFLFAEHASASDAAWTTSRIREVVARDPRAQYHIIQEGIAPDTFPTDINGLMNAFPELTQKNGMATVLDEVARGIFPSPPLAAALEEHYARAVRSMRALDLSPMHRDRRLATLVNAAMSQASAGTHDYYEWDAQFRLDLCSMAEQGIQFRVTSEIAPLSSVLNTLRTSALHTMARVVALRGAVPTVVQMTAGAYMFDRMSSDLRDDQLANQIRAEARANPAEQIIVPRGKDHSNSFKDADLGQQVRVASIEQSNDRVDINRSISTEALIAMARREMPSALDLGRMGRTFLESEFASSLVIDFGVSKAEAVLCCGQLCRAISDERGAQWLQSVVARPHASHPDLLRSTVTFLRSKNDAAAREPLEKLVSWVKV